jgi:hypothetical protein
LTPPRELIIRSRPSVRQSGHDSVPYLILSFHTNSPH